jgi:Tol biopolymer transport system component
MMTVVGVLAVGGCDSPTESAGTIRLEAITPTDLSGTVATAVTPTPTVRSVGNDGHPVSGVSISFIVAEGSGAASFATVQTDNEGRATVGSWILGTTAGDHTMTARAAGSAPVVFTARAVAGTLAPTGLQGRLAFVSDRDGNAEIYAVDVDGTGLQRLTTNPGVDETPVWSPDGDRIAFTTLSLSESSLWIMTSDGSDPARLAAGHYPSWSPDGTLIAFTMVKDGDPSIATVRLEDRAVWVLQQVPGVDTHATFSPDGERMGFVSDWAAYDLVYDVYTMARDGGDRVQLTHGFGPLPKLSHSLHPAWSPDGSMIAFVHGWIVPSSPNLVATDMRFHVAVMRPDGTDVRHLAWAGDIPWVSLLDPGSLAWSPDGRGIAYTFVDCDRVNPSNGCSGTRSVRYVSLDGAEAGTLVDNARDPSWRH